MQDCSDHVGRTMRRSDLGEMPTFPASDLPLAHRWGDHEVSVVICTYADARWPDLVTCLASVRNQTRPPAETVVVVDHNPPLMERVRALGVRAVENCYPRGLSGARNTGVDATCGGLIAFLDDDAVAAPTWLEQLVQPFSDPRVLGVGGMIEPLWEAPPAPWFPPEFYWVLGCTPRGMPDQLAPIRNPFGASMCIRREVFQRVGRFRTGIGRTTLAPMGCEETELCIRARARWTDGQFLFQPDSVVRHRVPEARTRWSYFVARCYAEGLSKAIVSRLVGPSAALSSERRYVVRTLPRGIVAALSDALLRRDPAAPLRAAVIVAGLAITTLGYVNGQRRYRGGGR